jgi:glyoxylase-like metal-dependent hydrolase (beta-lactamase superfamily II)
LKLFGSVLSNPRRGMLYASGIVGATLLVAILFVIGFVGYQLWPSKVDVARYADTSIDYRLPPPNPLGPDVGISLIITGHGESPEALIFRGGSLSIKRRTVFSGLLVRHPKATFLFEGGIGSRIDDEFERNFNWWQKQLFGGYVHHKPLLRQLADANIDPDKLAFLLLTHLHWDHAGVIRDLPGKTILVTRDEHDGMLNEAAGVGTFKEQFDDPSIKWSFVQFTDKAFGPFGQSRDLFDDGSIVLVPLAGHTPGGLGMFVTMKSGKRYFFIGDVSWAAKAVKIPAERIPFAEGLADKDAEAVRRQLVFIHELWLANPDLLIMPAHDDEALKAIPELPQSMD